MEESGPYLTRLEEARDALRSAWGTAPQVGVVLGSGLSECLPEDPGDRVLEVGRIPHFPGSGVAGHPGRVRLSSIGGRTCVALEGRVHLYEGYPLSAVVFPVRALAWWGVKSFVLANAAGGIHSDLAPGDLLAISDHLNLMGEGPLEGPPMDFLGDRFPDMTHAYSRRCLDLLHHAAAVEGIVLKQGVYAAVRGPNYETPAEILMLRMLGADAVGMSTVPEVIALRQMRREVAVISCITNLAAGTLSAELDHGDVLKVAAECRGRLGRLLQRYVQEVV